MTNKMWARRSLMSGMSAVAAAFALGARPASAQAAAAPFQPARHPQDEWLDKIPGKHRVVFDVISFRGVPEALHFANNIYSGNKSMYGLDQADLAVRHCSQTLRHGVRLLRRHLGEIRQGPGGGHQLHRSEEQRAAEGQPVQRDPDRNIRRDGQARRAVRASATRPAMASRAGSQARVEMPMPPTRRWSRA